MHDEVGIGVRGLVAHPGDVLVGPDQHEPGPEERIQVEVRLVQDGQRNAALLRVADQGSCRRHRPDQGKAEPDGKSCPAFQVKAKQNGETDSERGHLRHGYVDENDAALHDVQAEIDEQPRQKDAGHNWPKHYFPHAISAPLRGAQRVCRSI